jgi:hypothetical protein
MTGAAPSGLTGCGSHLGQARLWPWPSRSARGMGTCGSFWRICCDRSAVPNGTRTGCRLQVAGRRLQVAATTPIRNTVAAQGRARQALVGGLGSSRGWCPTAPPAADVPTVGSPPEVQQRCGGTQMRAASSSWPFLWVPEAADSVALVEISKSGASTAKLLFSSLFPPAAALPPSRSPRPTPSRLCPHVPVRHRRHPPVTAQRPRLCRPLAARPVDVQTPAAVSLPPQPIVTPPASHPGLPVPR